jgi:hypothetical protein
VGLLIKTLAMSEYHFHMFFPFKSLHSVFFGIEHGSFALYMAVIIPEIIFFVLLTRTRLSLPWSGISSATKHYLRACPLIGQSLFQSYITFFAINFGDNGVASFKTFKIHAEIGVN